jgi:N-acetyl-S-(2-succino)cysteine monooxygenase
VAPPARASFPLLGAERLRHLRFNQHTLAGAQEFCRDLKGRTRKCERPPEALKVMPGLNAIAGRTRKEAEELHHFLQSKIQPDVGPELLSNQLGGFDLSE